MNTRVILSPDAKADIRSVIEWYYRADPDLAFGFEQETRITLHHIGQFPFRFKIMIGAIRQALLKRFPYAVYYSLKRDEIWVSAVIHQRRSDSVWLDRGNSRS